MMAKYFVTVEARLSYAVVKEVYEVEATNVDEAEKLVLEGSGDLLDEYVVEGETIDDYVVEVCSFNKGEWVCT
tara:strand:+ start:630 stop:848 length:219 start_codon:yes stop_codon:yes gene_type:complete